MALQVHASDGMRLFFLVPLTVVVACSATPAPRDAVIMQVSPTEIHVRSTAATGEKLVCRQSHCEPDLTLRDRTQKCSMRVVGYATTTRALDDAYRVAQVTKGHCSEGDLVERAQ